MARYVHITTEVEVDVELTDFPTRDLIDEIWHRISVEKDPDVLDRHCHHLRQIGLPADIVARIEQWLLTPLADEDRLNAWKAMAAR